MSPDAEIIPIRTSVVTEVQPLRRAVGDDVVWSPASPPRHDTVRTEETRLDLDPEGVLQVRPARTGTSPRRRPSARVRRRRAVLMVAVGATLLAALALPLRPLAGASGSGGAGAQLHPDSSYTVQPGDSLWSIAERLEPGNPGAAVRTMEARLGTDTIYPGEQLRLP